MAHDASFSDHQRLDQYLAETQYVLDMYKLGKVTEAEAVSLQLEASDGLAHFLRDRFHARARNLLALAAQATPAASSDGA